LNCSAVALVSVNFVSLVRKVKILQLITNLPFGGAQDHTIYTVNLLNKERYEVWFAAMPGGRFDELDPEVHLEVIPSMRWEVSPWCDLRALWETFRFIRRERFDIVHTNISKAGILGRLAAFFARTPIVIHTIHTFPFHDFQARWKQACFVALERLAATITTRFIAVSRLNIARSLAAGVGRPEQFVTIYSCIDLPRHMTPSASQEELRRRVGLDPARKVVGVIGRLTYQKNPLCFVDAVARLATRYPECQFVMVGDGELRAEVETHIHSLGMADRIRLLGHRTDIPDMFYMMDIVVHTALYEGMPRVLAEAMAMRRPLIATDVDGVAEAVDGVERGLLVPPEDPAALAEAMATLLADSERCLRLGEAGYAWVMDHFDVRAMVQAIEALYEQLLAEQGAPHPKPCRGGSHREPLPNLPGRGEGSGSVSHCSTPEDLAS